MYVCVYGWRGRKKVLGRIKQVENCVMRRGESRRKSNEREKQERVTAGSKCTEKGFLGDSKRCTKRN